MTTANSIMATARRSPTKDASRPVPPARQHVTTAKWFILLLILPALPSLAKDASPGTAAQGAAWPWVKRVQRGVVAVPPSSGRAVQNASRLLGPGEVG